jgi:hypothetical protein
MNTGETIDIAKVKEACIHSFAVFCRTMQEDGYFDPVHEYLCDWTQKHILDMEAEVARRGTCNGRLCYVMPRGSLKSTIVTKYSNTWITIRQFYLFNNSGYRTLLAGNTYTNAKKKLNGIRGLFDSVDIFKALFPEMLPKRGRMGNRWSDEGAEINRDVAFDEATFECGGMNTKLTGRHYNGICEDDTTAPDVDEMKEELTRPSTDTIEKAIGFHRASMPLFVPKGFRISIIVSTRWAYQDLVSYVRDHESYKIFDMPAEKDGKPVFTHFYDPETLEIIKKRIGLYMYSMLYLNKPLDDSMRVFRSCDMQWISRDLVPSSGVITIACDPAISEKDESCETSITVCQHTKKGSEVHEYWFEDKNGHMNPMETVATILRLADKYNTPETPVKALIVEMIAYQAALRYMLINEMNKREAEGKPRYSIVQAKRGNKNVRIEGMQPAFQQKRIWFVSGSLSDQTESQLLQYPNGRLVDVIDSWSMHRRVWNSDRYPTPKAQTPDILMDFETTLSLHKKRKLNANFNSGLSTLEGVTGVGLGQVDNKYFY